LPRARDFNDLSCLSSVMRIASNGRTLRELEGHAETASPDPTALTELIAILPRRQAGFLGARPCLGGTHFRVWAPIANKVEVAIEGRSVRLQLTHEGTGYFSGTLPHVGVGDRYKFSLDEGEPFPDPASRYQPVGPHGLSEVVDPCGYKWSKSEEDWPGISLDGQVLYELHIGTFTPEGTFLAAIREFPRLHELGITSVECMPLAEFAGRVGWGYDGVALFAPYHRYGTPDELRRMIDSAHARGLGVILDVVYNHLGPDGNYLSKYSDHYFSNEDTDWGNGINFDGENSLPVREFYLANARHWIAEYHFDGLRLDATQSIHDNSSPGAHILTEIGNCVRASAGGRRTIVLAENEPQDSHLICPLQEDGFGLDAVWNDDFHHSAVVALTGRREAYLCGHLGRPQEFISAVKYGYLYQGQYYSWQNQPRGTSALGLDARAFVTFLENHDQVANFGRSLRLRSLSSPARYRAMTALWLLSPGTPMFFQGQEYGTEVPFHYFAGHTAELANAVSKGRRNFMLQFSNQDTPEMKACFRDPEDPETFRQSILDPSEQSKHPEIVQLHVDLLAIRRDDPVFRNRKGVTIDGAVLAHDCFVLRYLTPNRDDRLLVINLGTGVDLPHLPEPLVARPSGSDWQVRWSSEWPKYGGCGSSSPGRFGAWHVPGECTMLLTPITIAQPFASDIPKSGGMSREP
jgi:maltooligosyltrehalose trehalohydrolase